MYQVIRSSILNMVNLVLKYRLRCLISKCIPNIQSLKLSVYLIREMIFTNSEVRKTDLEIPLKIV